MAGFREKGAGAARAQRRPVVVERGSELRMFTDELRRSQDRLRNWFLWKVLFPLTLLGIVYPINMFVLSLPHPYESAFAQGELLVFAALILLEAVVEGDHLRGGHLFHLCIGSVKIAAFALLFVLGFLKADVLRHADILDGAKTQTPAAQARGEENTATLHRLQLYSSFNMGVAGVAVVASLASYLAIVNREGKNVLMYLAGDDEGAAG